LIVKQTLPVFPLKFTLFSSISNSGKDEHLTPMPWELRYQAVEQALREIEPDYEPGEPNYELPDIEHHPETGRYCQPS